MARYSYPAIFSQEKAGYSIRFPDFESCYTSALNLQKGIEMARDVLCLTLYCMEESNSVIPKASKTGQFETRDNEFTEMISCDTQEYQNFYNQKPVKILSI